MAGSNHYSAMRLSLGPLPYDWPVVQLREFYERVASWPLEIVYLGDIVCSKRRTLRLKDWIEIGRHLRKAGKQVALSCLTLIESESELGQTCRVVENGEYLVEANDLSAVQLCRERQLPFIAGPGLNVYNTHTLEMLAQDGMRRWVPHSEHSLDALRTWHTQLRQSMPALELEIIGWGRPALAYSARCFTARAHGTGKDQCNFRCRHYPDGLPLATRDGHPLLRINGVQIQGHDPLNLSCALAQSPLPGATIRLSPQAEGMEDIVAHFQSLCARAPLPV